MSFSTCKFFRSEQGCKFGNKCRYKHSDTLSPGFNRQSDHQNEGLSREGNRQQKSRGFPREYQQSVSNENGPVRYQQSSSNIVVPSSYPCHRDIDNEGINLKLARVNLQDQVQSSDLEYSFERDGSALNSRQVQQRPARKLCQYYFRNGTCCFGSKCRFEHVRPNREPAPPRFQQRGNNSQTQVFGPAADSSRFSDSHNVRKAEEEEGVSSQRTEYGNFSSDVADSPTQGQGEATSSACPVKNREAGQAADHSDNDKGGKRNAETPNDKPAKICQFYLHGKCWRGNKCKFLHPDRNIQSAGRGQSGFQGNRRRQDPKSYAHERSQKERETFSLPQNSQKSSESASSNSAKATGTNSTKSDGQEESEEGRERQSPGKSQKPASGPARPPTVARGVKKYERKEVDDIESSRLRRTEIDYIVKRFPKSKLKVNRDCMEFFQCLISFSPSDPDWPFDVRIFQLQFDIPSDYPFEMLTVCLPVEQDLPETVRRYLEVSIEEWLEEKDRQLQDKGQLELVVRPFIHWLDRHIEDVVTEGLRQMKRELMAKAAGLEFISAKQLQKQYPGQTDDDGNNSNEEEEDDDDDDDYDDDSGSDSQEEESSSDFDDDDYVDDDDNQASEPEGNAEEVERPGKDSQKSRLSKVKAMLMEPVRRGTELTLKNLQLKEYASTLYFEKLCLLIQCERCKGRSEFTAAAGRVNVVQCGQCGQTQAATYRPAMAHQLSSVIGYLDLDACLPFDLVLQNSSPVMACLHCSKESKSGTVLPGQPQDLWCRVCHHKLRVGTDGVRFTQLEPSRVLQSLSGSVKVVVPTRKRIPKDPAIQEGRPLPNFGSCKHYKKSYRWLRFPCCGKCYPCDVCHDSKEDHEMTFANRMVCGFCCREQPFSVDRPCKGCDMNLTKVHTQHWEGGQGCRDKVTMSRSDKHKHHNMSKTVSKHAQKVKEFQSKKKTKLRHT